MVLETILAVGQNRTVSEAPVVHSTRLKICKLKQKITEDPKQLVVVLCSRKSDLSHAMFTLMLVFYNVCFLELPLLFGYSMYILWTLFP